MTETAIHIENLGKRYRIGLRDQQYRTLGETITETIKAPINNLRRLRSLTRFKDQDGDDMIWALRDVSFDVTRGEVIGIIGANGAGKSTLLKILSRITQPSTGLIEIRGRVSSLLEVGTGFHPELTGRENIYLNGTVLGMRKKEIDRKFDEIVAFSDVEKFIDTPVKRYSSGMQVRLAFAVAAHLEPEILIVDEVLAVGDAAFQKKCLGKMEDVGKAGRTVLFVSHNMQAITRLCDRAILLHEGRMIMDGPSHQAVNRYLRSDSGTSAQRTWRKDGKAPGNGIVRLSSVQVRTEAGDVSERFDVREPIVVEMEYRCLQAGGTLVPAFRLVNEHGIIVFNSIDTDSDWNYKAREETTYISATTIPGNLLPEGQFSVGVGMATLTPWSKHFFERDAATFYVVDPPAGESARGGFVGNFPGVVRPLLRWETREKPAVADMSTTMGPS